MASSSLSSMVAQLMRAQVGSAAASVPDEDLDKYVTELILKEAKQKEEAYNGKDGIRAYLPHTGLPEPSIPKPSKRFLHSIIRNVDDHNTALLRAQAKAAEETRLDREATEREEARARAAEASQERLRRLLGGGRRRSRERRRDDEPGPSRKHSNSSSSRHRDRESSSSRPSRHRRSRSRSPSRRSPSNKSKSRTDWRTEYDVTDEDEPFDHKELVYDHHDILPRRSPHSWRDEDDPLNPRHSRHRSARHSQHDDIDSRKPPSPSHPLSRSPSPPSTRRSRSPSSRSPSPSPNHTADKTSTTSIRGASRWKPIGGTSSNDALESSESMSAQPDVGKPLSRVPSPRESSRHNRKRPKSPFSGSDDENGSKRHRKSRRRSRSSSPRRLHRRDKDGEEPDKDRHRSSKSSKDKKGKERERDEAPLKSHKLPSSSSKPRRHSPPTSSSSLPTHSSKMDKYFDPAYDPALDFGLELSKDTTSFVPEGAFGTWDAMLQVMRARREAKDRKRKGIEGDVELLKDDKDPDVMQVKYAKKGAVREWDLGKEERF